MESDLESHWNYDSAATGIGQLAEAYTLTGGLKDYRRQHTYDDKGRPKLTTQLLSDASYTSNIDYDGWGRLIRQTYQRGSDAAKVFDSRYNDKGYLNRIERGSLKLWLAGTQDAAQRLTQALLGNGLTDTRSYNANTGRLESGLLQTGAGALRLQEGYNYDAIGNVNTRNMQWNEANGSSVGTIETFGYDDLNRLTGSQITGMPTVSQSFTYDAAGNLTSKTGLNNYSYPAQGPTAVRPHAVSNITNLGNFNYDDNGNLLNGAGRSATWTSFDMPDKITKGTQGSTFVYGPEHQRTRQRRTSNGVTTSTVIYAGAQEVETANGQVTVKTYWPAGLGVEIDRPNATATELNWTHTDRLGSPVAISNAQGAWVEKLAYDAWGKRRTLDASLAAGSNPSTEGLATPDNLDGQIDNRGYTGHEMLDQLDLVHMNGRVYDPLTGRFLSADPFVQDPVNGQSYNRYSYVLNNPTNLTDPTGFAAAGAQPDSGPCGSNPNCFEQKYENHPDNANGKTSGADQAKAVNRKEQSAKGESGTNSGLPKGYHWELPGGDHQIPGDGPHGSRMVRDFTEPYVEPTQLEKIWESIKDVGGEIIYRAQGIPGEGVIVGGLSRLSRAATATEEVVNAGKGFVDPALVKFTQDSIKGTFRNGGSINELASQLGAKGGEALAKTIEPIRLVLHEGSLYTLDNRRLAAFAAAGREIPYRMATQAEIAWEWARKFKTTVEQGMGQYITVRPGK